MVDIVLKPNKRPDNKGKAGDVAKVIPVPMGAQAGTVYDFPPYEQYMLHLSSEHADAFLTNASGDYTTSGYRVDLEDIIKLPNETYQLSAMIVNAEIPVNWYIINDSNNRLTFSEVKQLEVPTYDPLVYVTVVMDNGNYDVALLCDELTQKVTASSPNNLTYTFTYDAVKHKVGITIASNDPDVYQTLFVFDEVNSVASQIGWNPAALFTSLGVMSWGDFTVRLQPHTSVYIRTNLISQNVYHPRTGTVTNVLAKIPITVPHNATQYYSRSSDFSTRIKNTHINEIVIELVDSFGHLLDMNGHHWSCSLEITRTLKHKKE